MEQQRHQGRVHGSSTDHSDESRDEQDVRNRPHRPQGQEDRASTWKTLGASLQFAQPRCDLDLADWIYFLSELAKNLHTIVTGSDFLL